MRQGQQNRRGRGRGRKTQNSLSRNMESNGPDVKIRGTASHIAEKYAALARDALSSGDTVAGENYLQHAEHYNRIIMTHQQAQQAEGAGTNGSGSGRGRPNGSGDSDSGEQPDVSARESDESGSDEISADEGVARTIARTTRRKSNGSGDDAGDTEQSSDESAG